MGQVVEARILETDDYGRLVVPAEGLGDAQPFSRYKVEAVGKKLSIEPEAEAEQHLREYEEWKREWDALSEEISAAGPEGVSPVDVVSELRR